jgi:NAD(P)-dependent dehydrogenase (short-subunit alcohol dehydrogenase family)
LLVGPLGPVCAALAAEFRCRGVVSQVAEAYAPGGWSGIVLFGGASASGEAECARLLELAQAHRRAAEPARVWIVTENAVAAAPGDAPGLALAQAPLWGFGRVLALEAGSAWGGAIDLPRTAGPAEIAALADELLAPDGEDQVALRAGGRRVLRLERMEAPAAVGARLRPDAAYWITGGLGALGLHVADWLARHGARQLVLTGRRAPSADAERRIEALRAGGARVLTLRADVTAPEEVRAVLAEAERSLGPVRGVVHAAGVARFDLLPALTPAELAAVLRPKLAGAMALDEATRGRDLDFLVFFSSVASVWGSKGQAHYAAANHFLDALAHERRAEGLPALSVNFGPWAGAGMAAGPEAEWLRRSGLAPLPPEEALGALERLLAGEATQAAVARVNWPLFREVYELRGRRPFLATLGREEASAAPTLPAAPAPEVARLAEAPADRRDALLVAFLQAEVAAVLGHPPDRLPDPRRGFFELGLDSLLAVEFSRRLSRAFARRLPATLAFDHANLTALADHLAAEALGWRTAAAPAPELDPALARRLERLEKLVGGG